MNNSMFGAASSIKDKCSRVGAFTVAYFSKRQKCYSLWPICLSVHMRIVERVTMEW